MEYLYPLTWFYERAGMRPPQALRQQTTELPDAQRRLLSHDDDMTPTLEAAWGDTIHIRALRVESDEKRVMREVVLELDSDNTPVEMGAIEIRLAPFSESARKKIVERRVPLGTILREEGIEHRSNPSAFFRLEADPRIAAALRIDGALTLYGRRNTIKSAEGRLLAEVVEILPPAKPVKRKK